MIGLEPLGCVGMMMEGDTIHVGWGLLSVLGGSDVGAEFRMGFTGLVEDGGCCFGVAPSVKQMLLMAGQEANLMANMMVCFLHRGHRGVLQIPGNLCLFLLFYVLHHPNPYGS